VEPDLAAITRAIDEIEAATGAFFERVARRGEQRRELVCEARYANQLWEIDVPLPAGWRGAGEGDLASLSQRFDRLHQSLFSVDQPGETLELLGFRGDARVERPRPRLAARPPGPSPEPVTRRWVRFAGGAGEAVDTPVYRGDRIATGTSIVGPAILEEATTSVVLDPGAVAIAAPAHYAIEVGGGR
jgi:N-methylhydantoinase A